MSTLVKICGIRDAELLAQLQELPIDYIGLLFAPSKRQVTAEQARDIIQAGKAQETEIWHARYVGVFVDPELAELEHIMSIAPLDVIQLHGAESPQFCRQVKERFGVQVWKVISVTEQFIAEQASLIAYLGAIDAILLDTHDPQYGGGSGQTFNWEIIPEYQAWADAHQLPMIVAGGLHAHNVDLLCEKYRPSGVDVSSGVETAGTKDVDKIKAFVGRVKSNV